MDLRKFYLYSLGRKLIFQKYWKNTIIVFILFVITLANYYMYSKSFEKCEQVVIEQKHEPEFLYEEAFLTYLTSNHLKLLEALVKSVQHFSTRPIIAYGIDFEINLSTKLYPQLIPKTISSKECGFKIYFCKPMLLRKSKIKYGVYMDVDTIANHKIDLLFGAIRAWPNKHVLAPIHWWDPENTGYYMEKLKISKKTVPYSHADSILWNSNNYEFIDDWFKLCQEVLDNNFDETALNLMLWKVKARHSMCLYDCFYNTYDGYMKNEFIDDGKPYIYMTFHGQKDPDVANKMFDLISLRDDKNNKEDYLNKSCCPKTSKGFKYHRFICEYS